MTRSFSKRMVSCPRESFSSTRVSISQQAPRITHATSVEQGDGAACLSATSTWSSPWCAWAIPTCAQLCPSASRPSYQRMPVVVFAFSEAELGLLFRRRPRHAEHIDRIFIWTGDTRILVAAIKLIEDAHEYRRPIFVRPRACGSSSSSRTRVGRYSSFLSLFYAELLQQAELADRRGAQRSAQAFAHACAATHPVGDDLRRGASVTTANTSATFLP
jgi:hypothetical protein